MIIVTGATGKLGRGIVKALIRRMDPSQVGASVRNVEKAQDLMALGVRVRAGDFNEPASLAQAFENATQILLVSSNASATGGDPIVQHRSAIEAAKTAGARRIVYTSHMAANEKSAFPPMLDHAITEGMLRDSGLAWTSLRNGFYADSGLMLLGDAPNTGVLEAPADAKVSWTAHADLAEAAAVILADEGRYEGPTPPLVNRELLDLMDFSAIASELTGRAISRVVLPDEQLRARMAARGTPAHVVDIVLGLYIASRNGEFASTDPTLEQLIGRRPIAMRSLMAQKIAGDSVARM